LARERIGSARQIALLAQRHFHARAGAQRQRGVAHPPAVDVGGAAGDGLGRLGVAQAAALGQEAQEKSARVARAHRQPQPPRRAPAHYPFSATRMGNFDSALHTMPPGPPSRSWNTPRGASTTAPTASGLRNSPPTALVSNKSSP